MELWGGVECTVNRVGDRWTDQLELTGHDVRLNDIDRIAELGLSALRYPVLWESVSPERPDLRDWSWHDARLNRLRDYGLRIIAGLIHHGSGPRYTDLTADSFAPGLAGHARAVAERYPWIEDWTPVNEPVTTARFSALYGHWHPHVREERSFWLALLNQIDATRASMRAIREVNPAARLIQTDDLGRTYATAPLRDQAAFDNQRRWAGWDLLCGRVTREHPLFDRLSGFGLGDRLRAITDDPCPPDIIGVNHYLTSDRFLDHRVRRYPTRCAGGNGQLRYVDIEAVRALEPAPPGLAGALDEAWRRYRIPLALTEVHNGCTRDEQMRWMKQAWDAAMQLRDNGADIRAVTSWALFGSSNWDTLLTKAGRYESGAFDISGSAQPRATALAGMLRTRALSRAATPIAQAAGWWQRPVRFSETPVPRPVSAAQFALTAGSTTAEFPILILGATGTLGRALAAACRHRNLSYVLTGRGELDLIRSHSIARALDTYRPWVVINAAGWVRVDDAELDSDGCFAANASGAIELARACDARSIQTVNFSSDLVFGGEAEHAYDEADTPSPCNVYGRSKLLAEQGIAQLAGRHLTVRTAAFFSPFDPHNFAWATVQALTRGEPFRAASDQTVSPTYVPHLADAVLDLAIDGEHGLWHLAGDEALTWSAFAERIAKANGLDASLIDAVPGSSLGWRAVRPAWSALTSRRGKMMPPLDHAIAQFAERFASLGHLAAAA